MCPSLTPSQFKVSITQLSCVPIRPLPPQWSAPLNCHRSPLYTLLPQTSASLNCRMPASTPSQSKIKTTQLSYVPLYSFSLKGQRHSNFILPLCPRLIQKSLPLNCHMPPLRLLSQRWAPINCHMSRPLPPSSSNVSITQLSCAPSTPFSTKGQYYSTVFCPTLPPSKLKVSTNQLSYVPPPPSSPSKMSTTQLS